ncbi:MAG: transcriptional regulator [Flavobacterium sp. BFFFF1]|uniref:helix-turn-helix transcriptional regulator n=1 Tax=unclassified Flavobacterium TaxID=196869 RepID=UPI000BD59451|nr:MULTISPECIES: helix-turn-helix transcriptional regulator [unclassified Flavobacterium]OYU81960.1 MAG: transcriptional regulator [Flavobacterium sp. BFFFF1]
MKNNLKVLRAMASISQGDLADKIQVSRQTINAMETGRYVPSTVLALKLARFFEKPVEEIFQLEDSDGV